ncbi:type-F conjugative transfer system pilin assembly protein TrbC [Geothermobacter hydrogeniphilus]|uniref:Type-F conjugative transfer system pilin assembly protein TrbC n=1 Tax=Geothermobacter hydrogeniphilus TaxID=1969733 RepID=A0A1X0XX49_9BACT|nr:type-F conjugative transfer system pilin assembly protein TrbC [Geothermobacter hydrogeniphilus]ORJ57503.1 hypothetical protein B5V00_13720 [Geothermobacter hydrogeniphilus]
MSLRRSFPVVVFTAVVGAALLSAGAGNAEPSGSLHGSVKALQQRASGMDIDLAGRDPGMARRAETQADRLVSHYRSPEFQRKLKQEQARIREILGLEGRTDDAEGEDARQGGFGRPVYVFVSSSVPLQTLRNYAADMAALEGYAPVMVFRGFVGGAGKIGPTANLVGEILKVDPGCDLSAGACDAWPVSVTVDPEKFRKFGIDRVPAIALDEGDGKDPLTVYGDASLPYALGLIAREMQGGRKAVAAKKKAP